MRKLFKFIPYSILEPETIKYYEWGKSRMSRAKANTKKSRYKNKRDRNVKNVDVSLRTDTTKKADVNMKSDMIEEPAASKKDNTSEKPDVSKKVDIEQDSGTFVRDVKKEFRNGFVKLIGWSLPLFVLGLLWNAIASTTYNNSLRIYDLNFSVTDNMILSPDTNSTLYKENDDQKVTYSYSYDATIKGHGKIESAWVAYAYDEDIIPVRIDINNTVFRIMHVNPSKIHFQVTYRTNKDETEGFKRAYLLLNDDKTNTHQVYPLVISNKDGKITWFREPDFLSISPMDQDIDEKQAVNLYIAFHRKEIYEEMKTIRSYFGE